ncbi:MAG: zinc-binding dehydrogenase [Armatimonadota bacterium]
MASNQALSMVLEEFGKALQPRHVSLPEPEPGAVLVRMAAAGVCGSDLDIAGGKDPRIRLPLVLGHEGVGRVEAIGGPRADIFGRPLAMGDLVIWNRGLSCMHCHVCLVRRQPALCSNRRVYGITIGADEPPRLNGCYGTHLYLRPETDIIKLPPDVDPAVVVPATCSGATAAHAVEQADIQIGQVVLILGPGPLGLFAAALAWERGARAVLIEGTRRGARRLALAESFGCRAINIHETSAEERAALVAEETFGHGADVVIDAAGTVESFAEAMALVTRGGRIVLPGVATPLGTVPVKLYEDLSSRNISLNGTWVSDTAHLWHAVCTVLSGRYPLAEMITHRFPVEQANEALAALAGRQATKAVLVEN